MSTTTTKQKKVTGERTTPARNVTIRRLEAEIETLKELLLATKEMIMYDPYKEDQKSLRKQLKDTEEDLDAAYRQLFQLQVEGGKS